MPLVAPSGTQISLVASSTVLALNGATDITAVLNEGLLEGDGTSATVVVGGGGPVNNGTRVMFTTSLGRLQPDEAETRSGRATVRLVADGRSGIATVTAFSGAATETIEVTIGSAAAARVALTANPQSLPGTGGTSTITARVEDSRGNGLSGIPITFSTSQGNLSRTTVSSDAEGVAETSLSTTREATVTASAPGPAGESGATSLSATVTVTVKPRALATITAPASATVGVPASFTITPTANAVLNEVSVDFGDGSSPAQLGALAAAQQISHAFRAQGISTVTVRATDSEGTVGTTSTQVAVSPLTVTLGASPSSPAANAVVTFTATVTAGAIIESYEWNFGDGNTRSTSGNVVSHAYAVAGQKVVSVRAIPIGNGTFGTTQITVNVTP